MPGPVIGILPYQPAWPLAFAAEAAELCRIAPVFAELEHIGSSAVPDMAAKPVIDMMAAVERLEAVTPVLPALGKRGYALVETGMRDRLFLQRAGSPGINLHIVTLASWPERNERPMRDALISAPKSAADHAALKRHLAEVHADDIAAYTRAKTDFVQAIIDAARDRLGLPREPVWDE